MPMNLTGFNGIVILAVGTCANTILANGDAMAAA